MGMSASKILRPLDFRSTPGRMLRGNTVYRGGSTAPNPLGINTQRAAKALLKKKRTKNG